MPEGKVALITGGSRGIGKEIAIEFAVHSAAIALIYSNNGDMAEEICRKARRIDPRSKAYQCDVSDFNAVKRTVDEILNDFGTIDILINNAGVTKDGLIMNMKEEAYDTVMDINLKGAFNMIRHCTPIFVKKKSGKIINISSVAGLMGNAGQTNYSASKAGLIGLTKSVARELASRNICCNAIAPGFIETDMTRDITENNPLMSAIPLGRPGLANEVAELAVFLATADYITGEVIRIDGGLAM